MLDSETKRRIDSCRDMLVGKIPDPKSQVEQITIALIYKFMDDMDVQAEELGGDRTFFSGDFAKYSWRKILAPGIGGQETLNLYGEAIGRMNENPNIPGLFRDIFKNAFLPYRDPETLRNFLKEINGFNYEHSEKLGDAFEYLLSVLGSQGDAGQFRTPRHIIDFMVEIISPQKGERIMDPACGTAGFLISAYKYILEHNKKDKPGDLLTPDERKKLVQNFVGFDISPDMVRLSLANMYLHGFPEPHIEEFDTLTSEDKWNEVYDVIFANPPFMSPKGGIRPHRRFSVESNRSEVLFVDYIAEHLSVSGRAAVVVPEGIIFQSGTAYKALRKMLVENYLVAVVSLPAGVFNPYSGVKTSILVLDRSLAKQSDTIAFFKVENDGFGLGAQRRATTKNDLPQVRVELAAYLAALQTADLDLQTHSFAQVIPKERISSTDDYNLSCERYGEQPRLQQAKWPLVALGEICTFMTGGTPTSTVSEYYEGGTVPWLVSGDIHGFEIWDCAKRITEKAVENSNARVLPRDSVLIALNGQGKTRGTVALLRMEGATCNQSLVAITPVSPPRANSEYIFWVLRSMYSEIRSLTGDTERSGLNMPILRGIQIPLPPLEVQREIVAEIAGYQRVINGARAVLDNYRPHIPLHPGWPMVDIGEVCNLINGRAFKPTEWEGEQGGGLPIIRIQNLNRPDAPLNYYNGPIAPQHLVEPRELLFSWSGSRGTSFGAHIWWGGKAVLNQHIFKVHFPSDRATKGFLLHILNAAVEEVEDNLHGGVGLVHITKGNLERIKIPLPPLATQQAIVAEIEAEQALVAANRELITRMETKIQKTLARIWGEPAEEQFGTSS